MNFAREPWWLWKETHVKPVVSSNPSTGGKMDRFKIYLFHNCSDAWNEAMHGPFFIIVITIQADVTGILILLKLENTKN